MKNKFLLLIGLCILGSHVKAQDSLIIDERTFLFMVWENSPYIKSQLLLDDIAEQGINRSMAVFQPTLNAMYERKQFDNKIYYNRLNSGLSVQTPAALKFSGGFNQISGEFVNPEAQLPGPGLTYASLEIPLSAGLLTDKYRTNLKLARMNLDATQIKIWLALNKYLFESAKRYWKWYESYMLRNLALEAQLVTRNRLDFVRSKMLTGEYAKIDSLEAFINLQNREAFYNEQAINFERRSRELTANLAFIEKPIFSPLADPEFKDLAIDSLSNASLENSHPLLRAFEVQQMGNEANKRLAREFFKPEINLKYSLQQNAADPWLTSYDPGQNQYWGVQFRFPLLLRSERARVKEFELREEIVDYEQQSFIIDLTNSLEANKSMLSTLDSNQQLWASASANYAVLLQAEQRRFFLGESNNFLVNRRETQWLETRKKYIKSYVEYRIRALEFYYLLALMPDFVGATL